MSNYDVFAAYYDDLTGNVNYTKRADYLCTLFSGYGVGVGDTVLDLACGTGSFTYEMQRRGFDMIGIDGSSEMLMCAREKAGDTQPPMFLCQQLEELDLYGTAKGAICMLDSVNHLSDPQQVQAFFDRLKFFMDPGGIFIFDVNTIYKHRNVLKDQTFVYDLPDVYCVWQNTIDTKTDTVKIHLDFFELDEDVYYRSEEEFCERAYSIEDLTAWLDQSGFTVEAIYDELTRNPLKSDSQRAFIVAKRKFYTVGEDQ